MKKISLALVFFGLSGTLLFAIGAKDRGNSTETSFAPADPFGKYSPVITVSTARSINSTVKFDQNNPGALSLDQNRWNKAYLDQLGVRLTYQWVTTDTASSTAKWSAAIASGDVPDFAHVSDNIYKLLYDGGYMAEMGDTFKQYASPELLNWISPDYYTQMTLDGKLRGFPLPAKAYHGGTLLWLRKDWLDKLNLPIPTSFEEVVATARAFQAAKLGGNETIGILLSNVVNTTGGVGPLDAIFNSYGAFLNYWLERDGKLVFSETEKEMRDALLSLQSLYKEGLINKDFAAINSQVALEYLSSGRAGLAYATSWSVSPAIVALWDTNPDADIINILPPVVRGRTPLYQVNPPSPRRMFVSNKSKYPEVGIKIANVTIKNEIDDYGYYCVDPNDSFYYYKFIPFEDMLTPITQDIDTGDAIRAAAQIGATELPQDFLSTHVGSHIQWASYKRARAGEYFPNPWLKIFGPGGYYTNMYDAYKGNMHLTNAFMGLPTETMVVKGNVIHDELSMTMFDVIMGADISVFDRAVERWKSNGGTQITNEVNEWYRSIKE
jgi:putative aldouronate transport system substrate-binding protein